MEISHVALWIANREATLDFYTNTLGLICSHQQVDEDGIENLYITDRSNMEIQLKYDPADPGLKGRPEVVDHIAFVVTDVKSLIDKVRTQTNYQIIKDSWTRSTRRGYRARLGLLVDPNGYTVELIEVLDG